MGALALGIVLIIGYYYQSKHPIRRLELIRTTGYHIYFKAGFSGFIFMILSMATWGIIDFLDIPSSIIDHFNLSGSFIYLENIDHWLELKTVAVFSIMSLYCFIAVFFRTFLISLDRNGLLERVQNIAHELELLIINCTLEVKPIRLELDCGKVYIGIPDKPNLEQGEVQFITMLPLLSGYVTDEKKIVFNNNYYRHYDNNFNEGNAHQEGEHSSMRDFAIVIPVKEIVIASRFSIEAFIQFRNDDSSELVGPPKPSAK